MRPSFKITTVVGCPGLRSTALATAPLIFGPIMDGGGLNMTVMSYLDSMDFGLNACSDLIPDVWAIADGLTDALEELSKAAARA